MEHVDVGGLRVAFQRQGHGPVLLLLHGAACDSRVWRVELEAFSDAFTVVAWDAPGCGGSADPPDTFRMGDFADCLAAFIEALDLDRPHLLGHSWGSTLALELCRRQPAMVRSLVLVGAYAGWAGSLPDSEVRQRLEFALKDLDRAGHQRHGARPDPQTIIAADKDLRSPPPHVRSAFRPLVELNSTCALYCGGRWLAARPAIFTEDQILDAAPSSRAWP